MENKKCKRDGCNNLLTGRQKSCCSLECKKIWFGESRKVLNPVWTKEFTKEYSKMYRKKNKEKLLKLNRDWCSKNREHVREENRKERERLKMEVLGRYSSNKICCAYCGFEDTRALQIDHIDNNGAEERREKLGNRTCAGTTFYRWIRRQNYPCGYQVLCANCNIIKLREFEKTKWR